MRLFLIIFLASATPVCAETKGNLEQLLDKTLSDFEKSFQEAANAPKTPDAPSEKPAKAIKDMTGEEIRAAYLAEAERIDRAGPATIDVLEYEKLVTLNCMKDGFREAVCSCHWHTLTLYLGGEGDNARAYIASHPNRESADNLFSPEHIEVAEKALNSYRENVAAQCLNW